MSGNSDYNHEPVSPMTQGGGWDHNATMEDELARLRQDPSVQALLAREAKQNAANEIRHKMREAAFERYMTANRQNKTNTQGWTGAPTGGYGLVNRESPSAGILPARDEEMIRQAKLALQKQDYYNYGRRTAHGGLYPLSGGESPKRPTLAENQKRLQARGIPLQVGRGSIDASNVLMGGGSGRKFTPQERATKLAESKARAQARKDRISQFKADKIKQQEDFARSPIGAAQAAYRATAGMPSAQREKFALAAYVSAQKEAEATSEFEREQRAKQLQSSGKEAKQYMEVWATVANSAPEGTPPAVIMQQADELAKRLGIPIPPGGGAASSAASPDASPTGGATNTGPLISPFRKPHEIDADQKRLKEEEERRRRIYNQTFSPPMF